jgi:hypothetical protein
MSSSKLRAIFIPLLTPLVFALSGGAQSSAFAQAPAAPPPPAAQPAPTAPPQAYPQQYPQQVYPQQTYPQQAYPQYQAYPQTVYVAQPIKPQLRPKRSLMIAGLSVLVASYGVAVVTGAALVDSHCCEDVGWSLLIPVAGPYIAAGVADEGKGLLVLLGTVQVIGLGLTIGGAVQYALTKNAANKAQTSALRLKLDHGRDLSFDMATSPRMMGPAMKLRF